MLRFPTSLVRTLEQVFLFVTNLALERSGRLSDIFGRKAITLFASAIFLLGSLGCGLSRTFPQLIAARAVTGIGGGGLLTMSSVRINHKFSARIL